MQRRRDWHRPCSPTISSNGSGHGLTALRLGLKEVREQPFERLRRIEVRRRPSSRKMMETPLFLRFLSISLITYPLKRLAE